MSTLQDPVRIGDWELPNRIIMAPLTRCRASAGRIPNDLMREYYQQRASAGLISSLITPRVFKLFTLNHHFPCSLARMDIVQNRFLKR